MKKSIQKLAAGAALAFGVLAGAQAAEPIKIG